jgi:hypothetical protein
VSGPQPNVIGPLYFINSAPLMTGSREIVDGRCGYIQSAMMVNLASASNGCGR